MAFYRQARMSQVGCDPKKFGKVSDDNAWLKIWIKVSMSARAHKGPKRFLLLFVVVGCGCSGCCCCCCCWWWWWWRRSSRKLLFPGALPLAVGRVRRFLTQRLRKTCRMLNVQDFATQPQFVQWYCRYAEHTFYLQNISTSSSAPIAIKLESADKNCKKLNL